MASSVFFNALQAIDANGNAVSGAKAYFYDTGTTTPQTVYADSALTTAHPSPLVADSSGVFPAVYKSGATDLKVNMTDSAGSTLPGYPIDPAIVQQSTSGATNVTFSPTARITATNVQDAVTEVDAKVQVLEDEQTIEGSVYTTGGTTTSYTISVSGVTAYTAGDRYWIRINATNTGAATLNISSLGTKNIYRADDTGTVAAIAAGELYVGMEYLLHFDGTQFVILSVRPHENTSAEWSTGTSTKPSLATPAKVKAAIDALAPAATGFQFIETRTIAGGETALDFTGLSAYKEIRITFKDVVFSASTNLKARVSTDNGTTFLSTGYNSGASDPAGSSLALTGALNIALARSSIESGVVEMNDFNSPRSTNHWGIVKGAEYSSGYAPAGANDAFQLLPAVGDTFTSGAVNIYGVKS